MNVAFLLENFKGGGVERYTLITGDTAFFPIPVP
jgi:hypothetical protein